MEVVATDADYTDWIYSEMKSVGASTNGACWDMGDIMGFASMGTMNT